jgi:hypothetical protein
MMLSIAIFHPIFRPTLATIVGTLMLGAVQGIVLAETAKSNPPIATLKRLTSGDRACYAEVMDDQGVRSTQFARFEICEQSQNLIGKRLNITYTPGNILAASCQGNVDCGKSDRVMLVTQVSLATTSPSQTQPQIKSQAQSKAKLQSKRVTFTRGTQGQDSYKQATVEYPILVGGPNPAVLKQAQETIGLKAVLGASIEEIEKDFKAEGWLSSITYQVNYNKNSILQLTYQKDGVSAYPNTFYDYIAVDLQTGKAITVADLFSKERTGKVAALINQEMQKRIQKTIAQHRDQDIDLKSRLANQQFQVQNLSRFVIEEKGIRFIYDFEFPHVIKALAPDGRFFLSYEQLNPFFQPVGRLGR